MRFFPIMRRAPSCSQKTGRVGGRRNQAAVRSSDRRVWEPGATSKMKQQLVDGDYAYVLWTAETAENRTVNWLKVT